MTAADRPARVPQHLSPVAKAWWRRIVRDYELEPHHLELLRLAAEAMDRGEEARAMVAKEGLVVKTASGSVKPHPAAGIARDAAIAHVRLLRELRLDANPAEDSARPPGLTRNSRARAGRRRRTKDEPSAGARYFQ